MHAQARLVVTTLCPLGWQLICKVRAKLRSFVQEQSVLRGRSWSVHGEAIPVGRVFRALEGVGQPHTTRCLAPGRWGTAAML